MTTALATAIMKEAPERVTLESSPLVAAIKNDFTATLRTAIQEISKRAKDSCESAIPLAPDSVAPGSNDVVHRALGLKEKAWHYLDLDVAAAMHNARLVTEIILKDLCRQRNIAKANQSLDQPMVGALLTLVQATKALPARIEPLVVFINRVSSTALHDQGPDAPPFADEVTRSVFCFLDIFFEWWVGQSQTE